MPKISVITPTHNGAPYLRQALDSVLGQSFADFEHIIVDDGSTDETPRIIEEYARRDARIRTVWREKASGGPTVPKNIALSLANSPYVCFLDQDDYFHPEKFRILNDGLDAHPQWVAAFHDLQLVEEDGTPHRGTYLSNAEFLNEARSFLRATGRDEWHDCGDDFYVFMSLNYAAIHTDSVMLARDRLLSDPVSFRAQFRGSDDTDLWLRVGAQGSLGYFNRSLAYYRQHGSNLSKNSLAMTRNAVELHEANYLLARHKLSAEDCSRYRRKIASYQTTVGYLLNQAGRYREARAFLVDAVRNGALLQAGRCLVSSTIKDYLPRASSSRGQS